ncbi:hypothetical protein HKT40_12555, partial [Pseudomonas aeruginosa]|nr:hypothetical protein [Pseudomonas aeruginosa]
LYYAPDPSSQIACSIGGNVAENAGGICHILVGPRAAALSQALQPLLRR